MGLSEPPTTCLTRFSLAPRRTPGRDDHNRAGDHNCSQRGQHFRCALDLCRPCFYSTRSPSCAHKLTHPLADLYVISLADGWTLLIRQTSPNYLDPVTKWLSVNPADPGNDNYSILDRLDDSYKNDDGKFEFKLVWPNRDGDNYNQWKQSTNPVKEVVAVEGYEAVDVKFTSSYWSGLENGALHGGSTASALLDGSVNQG